MAIQSGYCTNTYADDVNAESLEWDNLEDEQKTYAISIARMYIDDKYVCSTFEEPYPDELLTANALFADKHAKGLLFINPNVDTKGMVISKRVKAGSVESETEYSELKGNNLGADRFTEISMLLSIYCSFGKTRLLRRT